MTRRPSPTDASAGVDRAAAALGARIEAASAALGRPVALDWPAVLRERAALERLDVVPSATSPGGACRIERCADGWIAVSLARPSDQDLVPAWLALAGVAAAAQGTRAALAEAAALVGLPVGALGEHAASPGGPTTSTSFGAAAPIAGRERRVLDLSALWAGPLCARILGLAGMEVTRVESLQRPDASRSGSPALFARLNDAKALAIVDLSSVHGRTELAALVRSADVVVESSRPRALEQLGVVAADELTASVGPSIWISITSHGRSSPRVGFGDDAAVAGGLVAWVHGEPCFAGDALADPLAGLAAAAAALEHLVAGERALVDAPLASAAAWAAGRPLSVPISNLAPKSRKGPGFGAKFVDDPDTPVPALVIVDAEVGGRRVDVRIEGDRIAAVAPDLPQGGAEVVDAEGGALLPGLHDHHLHLLAMAAARRSLDAGGLADAAQLDRAVADAHRHLDPATWLRIVGVDDRHGRLDRHRLDALAPGRPVRAQHRSGAAWVLSSAALAAVGEQSDDGWIHRHDAELGRRWGEDAPDLAPIGTRLASLGVTGVTDATPFDDPTGWQLLAEAHRSGALPQRVVVTGGHALAGAAPPPGVQRGPVKVVVADDALPTIGDLGVAFRQAHRAGRPVAVHCVTRVGLVVALAAWEEVGAAPGDRIEHGSILPLELLARIAELGLTVVTQPAFLHDRGDRYLAEVDADDLPHLYRCGSLVRAGIPLGLSTDAPFGPDDPWSAIATAVERRAEGGAPIGPAERLSPRAALGALLSTPQDPGGPARRVAAGAPADLCLLGVPLTHVLAEPSSRHVRATFVSGVAVQGELRAAVGAAR